jgi:hypothetical protein
LEAAQWTCIRDVPGSNLSRETVNPLRDFSWFFSVLSENAGDTVWIVTIREPSSDAEIAAGTSTVHGRRGEIRVMYPVGSGSQCSSHSVSRHAVRSGCDLHVAYRPDPVTCMTAVLPCRMNEGSYIPLLARQGIVLTRAHRSEAEIYRCKPQQLIVSFVFALRTSSCPTQVSTLSHPHPTHRHTQTCPKPAIDISLSSVSPNLRTGPSIFGVCWVRTQTVILLSPPR